jgi:hypothetical protein
MTTCTPVYRLPIIEGTDRSCDQSDTWCAFAGALETELDRLDAVVARTATALPFAKVSLGVPQTFNATTSGSRIAFDTILDDSDNMVDLTANPGEIRAQRAGVYAVRCYIELGTTGSTANSFLFRLSGQGPVDAPSAIAPSPGGTMVLEFPDPGIANSMTWRLRSAWRVYLPQSRFFATITYGAIAPGATAQLTRAEMDVVWMGD